MFGDLFILIQSSPCSKLTPIFLKMVRRLRMWLGSHFFMVSSDEVAAAIKANDPVSMRSGIILHLPAFNLLTPLILMLGVPAPSIFAPWVFKSVSYTHLRA